MILKKVKITNYRQLQNVELDMQDSLTVLAGPNNSGKTTLISVLKGMFCDKKLSFNYSDIPIQLSSDWMDKILPIIQAVMIKNDRESGVREIITKISNDDKFIADYIMDSFQAQIQVDYNPDNDDIQYFADYLMDLDDTKHSFYFIYTYEPSISSFEKNLTEHYDRMSARFRDINNPQGVEKDTKLYFLKEELLRLYCNAAIEKCYFCNSDYGNANPMEVFAFKKLFNFQNIPAIRELDDSESDSSKGISKRVISLLKDNDTWVEATKKLPDLLMSDIENSGAKNEIKNSSIISLDDTIRDISKTSGGHIGKLQLEMDVSEHDVEEFIQRITRAKYDIDGLLLNEDSQGLGFSNLIYLHMRLEEFYKSIESNKVNVFFIEEPESHMHPQMQNVFIRFLKRYYMDKKIQGLITTHSNEIARMVGLDSLRVIRQTGRSKSELFNLSKFRNSIKGIKVTNIEEESQFLLENFFDWFFEIGYSELIFADRVMQQIYKNYDGSFEERMKKFDTSDQLVTNFRSIGKIVSILNNIYNDASFKQHPTENNIDVVPDIVPQVIISSNAQECIYELQKEFPEILTLYLMNKEKYQEIGAQNLYNAYENMEKYSFGRKYSPMDILSDMSSDNPDILMKFLFLLNNIMSFYANENYGMVISLCKKESKYFDSSQFKIKKHTDKQRIKNKFDKIQVEYEKEGCLIRDIVECLFANGFIPEAVKNDFEESTEYQSVLDIKIIEVKNLARYLNMPHISTQHGVKGESHPSVIFMASDNNSTPNVRMYPFFELWSNLEFSLPQFETLFYSYNRLIEKVEAELGMKISELTAETHNKSEKNKAILVRYSNEVLEKYQGNILFDALCKDDFISYLAKQNVGNAKKIFKITKMEGILTAYKLFYVGCSRARKNLIVVVDAYKVNGFKEAFMNKMKEIGFSVFCK